MPRRSSRSDRFVDRLALLANMGAMPKYDHARNGADGGRRTAVLFRVDRRRRNRPAGVDAARPARSLPPRRGTAAENAMLKGIRSGSKIKEWCGLRHHLTTGPDQRPEGDVELRVGPVRPHLHPAVGPRFCIPQVGNPELVANLHHRVTTAVGAVYIDLKGRARGIRDFHYGAIVANVGFQTCFRLFQSWVACPIHALTLVMQYAHKTFSQKPDKVAGALA